MSNYIKLTIANSIAIILNLFSYVYIHINSSKLGLGAVGAAIYLIIFFGIYLVVYGIVSCKKTKSVIFPNLILLGFVIVNSILFCVFIMGFVRIFKLATMILMSMLFSLIPSMITKVVMVLVEKHKPDWLD